MKKYLNRLHLLSKWRKFYLADRCLLIIMAILMIQTAHNLFLHEITMQDSATLDVVIRTTTAAIFGYFISANFHIGNKNVSKNNHDTTNAIDLKSSSDISSLPKARIGFNKDLAEQELPTGHAQGLLNNVSETDNQMQITIVAGIGIVSLIFILIARNYSIINTTSVATLSQLRDFISGSVGFLISQSTRHTE